MLIKLQKSCQKVSESVRNRFEFLTTSDTFYRVLGHFTKLNTWFSDLSEVSEMSETKTSLSDFFQLNKNTWKA